MSEGLSCLPLTVMASMRHGWVVLEMPVLVLRHCGGEAAVSAPVRVRVCDRKQTGRKQVEVSLERHANAGTCTLCRLVETHWRVRR